MLPREYEGIPLLAPAEGFEKRLRALGQRVSRVIDEADKGTGLLNYAIMVEDPNQELIGISYIFYQGKLVSMKMDFNMQTFEKERHLDFDAFLSGFKRKYGEPVEIEHTGVPIFGIQVYVHRWKDDQTLLEVSISPPGKDPFKRPHLGMIQIRLHDRDLKRKYNQDIWNHMFPKVREGIAKNRKFIKKDPDPDRMIWFKQQQRQRHRKSRFGSMFKFE